MALRVVTDLSVLAEARTLVDSAKSRLWIASAWIRGDALRALVGDLAPRIAGGLDVRIVYRVKEAQDLSITELSALEAVERMGAQVRFSRRLHAKTVINDDVALVTSSNLTATAGYGNLPSRARNEELGLLVSDDDISVAAIAKEFEAIWNAAEFLGEDLRGVSMIESTVGRFQFIVAKTVRVGEFVTALTPDEDVAVGRVVQLTALNPSFPELETDAAVLPGGYRPGPGRGLPSLGALFSDPSKMRGLLITTTFFNDESMFQIADVEVMKVQPCNTPGRLTAPSVPVSPGSLVKTADRKMLGELLGESGLVLGTVRHHPEVPACLNEKAFRTLHVAVLGMTGSGKSNAVKHLVRTIVNANEGHASRVMIIDTHGEYVAIADDLAPSGHQRVEVDLKDCITDEGVLKSLAGMSRADAGFTSEIEDIVATLEPGATVDQFLAATKDYLNGLRMAGPPADKKKTVERLVILMERALTKKDRLCVFAEQKATLLDATTKAPVDFADGGLWIVDLADDDNAGRRAEKAAAVATYAYQRAKGDRTAADPWRCLLVVDEAHNYAPEQHTGSVSSARPSLDALHRVAAEGRKFGVGLILATQRPARLNKEVLSQCNTHIVFRLANVEDHSAVAACFEGASWEVLAQLPALETGTCIVGGAAIAMAVQVEVPNFEVPNAGAEKSGEAK